MFFFVKYILVFPEKNTHNLILKNSINWIQLHWIKRLFFKKSWISPLWWSS